MGRGVVLRLRGAPRGFDPGFALPLLLVFFDMFAVLALRDVRNAVERPRHRALGLPRMEAMASALGTGRTVAINMRLAQRMHRT